MYKELGAELKIDKELPKDQAESFNQLIADQPEWIRNFLKFVRFTPDPTKYDKMNITIDDVLMAHDKGGYLVAVSDGSVKHIHQMIFGWVLLTAKGLHLAKSFGQCDGRGSSLRAEAVEILFILIFIALP